MLIKTYVNRYNSNKFVEVHISNCRHITVRQFMWFESGVRNFTGDGKLHRWSKKQLDRLLEDYSCVGITW